MAMVRIRRFRNKTHGHFNPDWQIMENLSRNFKKFRGVTQAVLLENSSLRYVTFGLDEFFCRMASVTPQNSLIDDWMSFPVKRSSS